MKLKILLILFISFLFITCVDENADKWELQVENRFSIDLDIYITTNIQSEPFTYLTTVASGATVNEVGFFEYETTYFLQARDIDGLLYDEFVILTKDSSVGPSCLWVLEP